MFLFEAIPWYTRLMLLHGFSCINKWTALACFLLLPLLLPIFIWPKTTGGRAGKSHYCALGHTAHKLVRVIFTLLSNNIAFDLP